MNQLHWNLHLCLNRSLKCLTSKKTTKNLLFLKQLLKKQLLNLQFKLMRMKPLDLFSNPHQKQSTNPNITKLISRLLSMSSTKRSQPKLKIMKKFNLSSSIMKKSPKKFTTCMQQLNTNNTNTMMRFYTHMFQYIRRNRQYNK